MRMRQKMCARHKHALDRTVVGRLTQFYFMAWNKSARKQMKLNLLSGAMLNACASDEH